MVPWCCMKQEYEFKDYVFEMVVFLATFPYPTVPHIPCLLVINQLDTHTTACSICAYYLSVGIRRIYCYYIYMFPLLLLSFLLLF